MSKKRELPPDDRDKRDILKFPGGRVVIHRPRQRPDDEVHFYRKRIRWGLLAAIVAAGGLAVCAVVKGVRQRIATPDTIEEVFDAVIDGRVEKEKALKKQLMLALQSQPRVTLPNGITMYIDESNGNAIYAELIHEGYFYETFVHEEILKNPEDKPKLTPHVWFRWAAENGKGFPRMRLEDEHMDGKDITGRSYADEGQGMPLDPQEAAQKFDQALNFFSSKLY